MDIRGIAKTALDALSKHSPEIFTGLGIVGFGTTVVMVAKASPKASAIHKVEKQARDEAREASSGSEETARKVLTDSYLREGKRLLPLYGPPAAVGMASIACFIASNKIQVDRQAALMTAYSLSTETLARYQDKVIEKLGEAVESDIMNETVKEVADNNEEAGYCYDTEPIPAGQVRVYDNVTGRYFYCNRERIAEAVCEVNKMLLDQVRVTLQEFYYQLGFDDRFNLGEMLGWDISSPFGRNNKLDVFYGPHLDDDKNPCLAINYHVMAFERDI